MPGRDTSRCRAFFAPVRRRGMPRSHPPPQSAAAAMRAGTRQARSGRFSLAIKNKRHTFAKRLEDRHHSRKAPPAPRHMKKEALRLTKYGLVGVMNTLVTLAVFFGLRRMGAGVDLANFAGYAAGICNAFLWSKLWVFRSRGGPWRRESAWFLTGAGTCWLLQWGVFRLLLCCVPEAAAQLLGMCAYTLLNYAFNRLVTFSEKRKTTS